MDLPKIPEPYEWVISTDSDRTTVHLAIGNPNRDRDQVKIDSSGFLKHHTFKHAVDVERFSWEEEAVKAAEALWAAYLAANKHAKWADEMIRKSRES